MRGEIDKLKIELSNKLLLLTAHQANLVKLKRGLKSREVEILSLELPQGRNAEDRAIDRQRKLDNDVVYQQLLGKVDEKEAQVNHAKNAVEIVRAEIGLVKAWLYSQAQIG
jgi:hypothetical protein